MAWELKKVEEQRKELVELYIDTELTMSEICKRYGVSRKTGYKWVSRYEEYGEQGLYDLEKTPKKLNQIYSDEQIEKALDLKYKYSKWGPRKIKAKLEQLYPEKQWPSGTRLYEIFKEKGLIRKRRLRRRVPATHRLGEPTGANEIWAADFKGWFRTGNGEICEPFTLHDGHTRYMLRCIPIKSKKVEAIWPILDKAFYEYGVPKRLRTDNGPPFGSVGVGRLTGLSVNLIKAGVTPEWIKPGAPQENGRLERFHRTLKEEVASPPAKSLKSQIKRIDDFIDEYNYDRPHEALDMKAPGECYYKSERSWDGILKSPEYDTRQGEVRKVGASGSIWVNGVETYISSLIKGEYVQLIEGAYEGRKVYYGPVYLGLLKKNRLEKPKIGRKNRPKVLPM